MRDRGRVAAALIVNPFAHAVTGERLAVIERHLEREQAVTTFLTERRGHATELARSARSDVIYAYGGDGTFNEVLNGVDGSIPLGFIPGGHTNVLTRALGLPRDPLDAVRALGARRRRIALGRVNGRRFAFAAGIGVDADAVQRIEAIGRTRDGERPGDLVYMGIVLRLLLRGYPPRLELCGHGRAGLVLVSNDAVFTYAGPLALRLSPCARFEDGFDFVAPRRIDLRTLMRLAPRLALGRGLAGARGVLSAHDLDRLEVVCDEPLPLQADGEDLGEVREAAFEAERGAVTVLV